MGKRAVISRRACGELEERALLGPTRITAAPSPCYFMIPVILGAKDLAAPWRGLSTREPIGMRPRANP